MKNIKLTNAQKPVLPTLLGACMEDVNHELYGGIWSQMIFGEAFEEPAAEGTGVSGMWQPFGEGRQELLSGGFSGSNRQVLKNAGVYNRGLNKSGMYFKEGKEYRGYLIAKADEAAEITVSLRGADPEVVYDEYTFTAEGDWAKYNFTLTAKEEEIDGAFGIYAKGEAAVGYAFLETGEWGLYKGLHVRRDVGEALENMGIGILRFGGCMANAKDYLWKNMTGAPEYRKPYKGWWYLIPLTALEFWNLSNCVKNLVLSVFRILMHTKPKKICVILYSMQSEPMRAIPGCRFEWLLHIRSLISWNISSLAMRKKWKRILQTDLLQPAAVYGLFPAISPW